MSLDTLEHERIHKRSGHIAAYYRRYLMVWGGSMEDITTSGGQITTYHAARELLFYNPLTEIWHKTQTNGDIPPRSSGSCGVLYEDYLYVFGGYQGTNDPGSNYWYTNSLHRLHIPSKTWEKIHPSGIEPVACDKLVGWHYKGNIYFFGGFGSLPDSKVPFLHVVDNIALRIGWNNQLVCYNLKSNAWEWPKARNFPPCPRAAHAADISNGKAYIFGGRCKDTRMNDLYYLDLESLEWSEDMNEGETDIPCGRSWHSFTFVSSNRAIVYGGFSQNNTVLSDCWFLFPPDFEWEKANYDNTERRLWHVANMVHPGQLILVGGHRENVYDFDLLAEQADHLIIINLSPKSLLKLCCDDIVMNKDMHKDISMLPPNLHQMLIARYQNEVPISTKSCEI